MAKEKRIPNETNMYSLHPQTKQVLRHRLPWGRDSAQLNRYIEEGYVFDPAELNPAPPEPEEQEEPTGEQILEVIEVLDNAPVVYEKEPPELKPKPEGWSVPDNMYYCQLCGKNHHPNSRVGKKHKQYAEA